jgi:hypothetical protein
MNHVISRHEGAIEPLQGTPYMGTDARPTPGTWEDQVFVFAGCYEFEDRPKRDLQDTHTCMAHDSNVMRAHVSELITVASAVETFLEGYLKANPGHSLATILLQALQARLRVVEGEVE